MQKKIVILVVGCLCLQGCSAVVDRQTRVDPRVDRPAPEVFGEAIKTLPGKTLSGPREIEGIWHFSTLEQRAQMEHGLEPFLYYALFLKFEPNGRYELVYQAYWGTRNLGDARAHAVDVRESGHFRLSGRRLLLEPERTRFTQKKSGQLTQQTIADENRTYLATLDGAYLNIAGRCARFQVEPICLGQREVWYSMRHGRVQWPVPALQ